MPHFSRHFDLEEAQAQLAWIRPIFSKVRGILASGGAGGKGSGSGPNGGNGSANGRSGAASHADSQSLDALVGGLSDGEKQELLRGLIKEVLDAGVIVQDARRGLIDFPAFLQSREVFLCYESEDGDRIQFWHEIEDGYAGRNEIEPGQHFTG